MYVIVKVPTDKMVSHSFESSAFVVGSSAIMSISKSQVSGSTTDFWKCLIIPLEIFDRPGGGYI